MDDVAVAMKPMKTCSNEANPAREVFVNDDLLVGRTFYGPRPQWYRRAERIPRSYGSSFAAEGLGSGPASAGLGATPQKQRSKIVRRATDGSWKVQILRRRIDHEDQPGARG